ncbi:MAG: glycosyl hydrolase family protein, partial [Pedobacter sp.]
VYPASIYHMLKKYSSYTNMPSLIVTENGAAFPDILRNGIINDQQRIDFLQKYIGQVLRARNEGVNVNGYYVWTLLDNFEWAEGYHPKFGLVHVDFSTQQRIVKASGNWYKAFLKNEAMV